MELIAIIPCAGKGKRRAPDTDHKPKILLEHQGEPLIEHIVRPIDESGLFDKIVLVISPRQRHGEMIYDYIKENPFSTPIAWTLQNEPLGFGHAVLQAKDEVFSWRRRNPPVLVVTDDGIRCDVVPAGTKEGLIEKITASEKSTLGVQWRGNVREHGMVIVEGARERGVEGARKKPDHLPRPNSPAGVQVERLVEKPYWDEGGLVMTGIYFVRESRRLFRCLRKLIQQERTLGGEYQFTHALQMMIDQGTPFRTHYHEWVDCGRISEKEDLP